MCGLPEPTTTIALTKIEVADRGGWVFFSCTSISFFTYSVLVLVTRTRTKRGVAGYEGVGEVGTKVVSKLYATTRLCCTCIERQHLNKCRLTRLEYICSSVIIVSISLDNSSRIILCFSFQLRLELDQVLGGGQFCSPILLTAFVP